VAKDGKIQSLRFGDASPNPSIYDASPIKSFVWKAQDPQVAATDEDKVAWQAVTTLLKSLPL
jgi:hypothetical protein